MQRYLFIISLLFSPILLLAQEESNSRTKYISVREDTILLDSLSIIPNSLSIDGIDSNSFTIDYAQSLFVWHVVTPLHVDSIRVSYRVFPFSLSQSIKHKDIQLIVEDAENIKQSFIYTRENQNNDIFNLTGLNKSGSISRGVNFGNNQDLSVNSNLDLKLSGGLNEQISILAAITDDNIPIQPEGNTQQLQEFDKVYIQLFDEHSQFTAGDFELKRPDSYFMNYYKKARGGNFSTSFNASKKREEDTPPNMTMSGSAAVSKGKFARNTSTFNNASAFIFNNTQQEANQGPYKLIGNEKETFIIVLSGTEKVYIDGEPLQRGQQNDYIIDYNTAEITFTPNQPITKDKRIVVEFQYSDKNYARSLFQLSNDYESKKLKLKLNFYTEQDAKNQPLQQELTDNDKAILANIGDNLNDAVVKKIDSIGFTNDRVLYKKVDSLGYDSVYVYSTNPDSAFYQLIFSHVGEGRGNYIQLLSTANGRVFKWVAPDLLTGALNGKYEPVILLTTPKKKQMATLGGEYVFSKHTKANFEIAVSNQDINTFSPKDNNDNVGYGFKMDVASTNNIGNDWVFSSSVNYEQVSKYFSSIERYRNVEFERDWNLSSSSITYNQYSPGVMLGIAKKNEATLNYQFNSFFQEQKDNAIKHTVQSDWNRKGFQLQFNGSWMQSKRVANETSYIKHNALFAKKWKHLTIGIKEQQENNQWKKNNSDTLLSNSFYFSEWEVFAKNADTAINKYTLNYRLRTDYIPSNNAFEASTLSENVGFVYDLLKNPKHHLKVKTNYRKLSFLTASNASKPEKTLLNRIEYDWSLWKGAISSNTFYEIGAGMEVKKEFVYLEVASGQGVYTWMDYDKDSIQDLNEFEIANFRDQANFIKVYVPTNDYIKTYTNQFSQLLNIRPAAIWSNTKGIKSFLARWSNQTAYHINRKTNTDNWSGYNPFESGNKKDGLITLNLSLRNTLYFNRTHPKWGMDLNYQDNSNQTLLTNGFDSRNNVVGGINLRWNVSRIILFNAEYKEGTKTYSSEYFGSKDYYINYYQYEPKITYQPGTRLRTAFFYQLILKNNHLNYGGEQAKHQKVGTDITWSVLSKGNLIFNFNFIQIKYTKNDHSEASANTTLAYEMLEGLQPGQNMTWNVAYQRTLANNLQLILNYSGRKSEETKTIHTGGVEVRAYF